MGWIGTEFGARWAVAFGGAIVLLTGLAATIVVSRRSSLSFRPLLFDRGAARRSGSPLSLLCRITIQPTELVVRSQCLRRAALRR